MNHHLKHLVLLTLIAMGTLAQAQPGPTRSMIDLSSADALKRIAPSSKQVTAASSDGAARGLAITIQPGTEGYPGLSIKPEGTGWDLSAFGHVEARIVNTGEKNLNVSLRLDNAGDWRDNPWNAESISLKPGAGGTVKVIFGHAYGQKPNYPLKPESIVNVLIFAIKSDAPQSFRIESLVAAGPAGEKPPVDPNAVRAKPKDGLLLGEGVAIDAKAQITTRGAKASMDGSAMVMEFAAAKAEQSVSLKPAQGRWDLRDALEMKVTLTNAGQAPATARLRVESNGGPSEWSAVELAGGASKEVTASFLSPTIWTGQKGDGNRVTNDAVSGLTVSVPKADAAQTIRVTSIKAGMPAAPALPAWLGQRPPVEGEWTMTFSDDFNGTAIDATKWNIYGENYWDKQSHFSKDNVIVGDGVVRLRFEKKAGFQNDDPKHKRHTAYAAGFLDTLGKFTQRYGYFEARMKVPAAPGLWPAFWMMPDRGKAARNRQSTGEGGMEIDIFEHLTRWGPTRYNIAMHWDGYGKEHKSTGSDKIYVQPDKDGFVTAGVLWTPGSLVFYGNGREVARWENARVGSVPGMMMFTLPMGGWDNSPLDDKQLPADFIIDYAKVWQRKDLAEK